VVQLARQRNASKHWGSSKHSFVAGSHVVAMQILQSLTKQDAMHGSSAHALTAKNAFLPSGYIVAHISTQLYSSSVPAAHASKHVHKSRQLPWQASACAQHDVLMQRLQVVWPRLHVPVAASGTCMHEGQMELAAHSPRTWSNARPSWSRRAPHAASHATSGAPFVCRGQASTHGAAVTQPLFAAHA
jgi:hypothetical protein